MKRKHGKVAIRRGADDQPSGISDLFFFLGGWDGGAFKCLNMGVSFSRATEICDTTP